MKNLPERQMDELRDRLRNYTELPDDDRWEGIAVALPGTASGGWVRPVVLGSLFLLYTSVVWLAGRYFNSHESIGTVQIKEKNVAITTDSTLRKPSENAASNRRLDFSRTLKNHPVTKFSAAQVLSKSRMVVDPDTSEYHRPAYSKMLETSGMERQSLNVVAHDAAGSAKDSLENSLPLDEPMSRKSKPSDEDVIIEKSGTTKAKPVLYFQIGPSLSYQKIIPFRDDDTFITKLNSKSIFSGDRVGVSVDAGLQWRLMQRLELYTGLSYHQESGTISFTYQSDGANSVESNGTAFGYVITPTTASNSFSYSMKNFGGSMGVLYLLQGAGLRHKIGAGLQYQVGLSADSKDAQYQNSASSYLNYQLLYRVEFPIGSKYAFFIQPSFTHSLIVNERLHVPFDMKHYNAALGLGLVHTF
jgi:hypothetical protein